MNNNDTFILQDDRFDKLYINFKMTFYGEELKDEEIVYQARKMIKGYLYFVEVKAPKESVNDDKLKEHYLNILNTHFENIRVRENGEN